MAGSTSRTPMYPGEGGNPARTTRWASRFRRRTGRTPSGRVRPAIHADRGGRGPLRAAQAGRSSSDRDHPYAIETRSSTRTLKLPANARSSLTTISVQPRPALSGFDPAKQEYAKEHWRTRRTTPAAALQGDPSSRTSAACSSSSRSKSPATREMVERICGTTKARLPEGGRIVTSNGNPRSANTIVSMAGPSTSTQASRSSRGGQLQLLLGNVGGRAVGERLPRPSKSQWATDTAATRDHARLLKDDDGPLQTLDQYYEKAVHPRSTSRPGDENYG